MHDTLSAQDRAALARLWCRGRGRPAPEDLALAYQLVQRALGGCSPPELHALGESRQELVAQFIYRKVLRLHDDEDGAPADAAPRPAHSAPSTAFALRAYFRRYLIDCTRAAAFRRGLSIDSDFDDDALATRLPPAGDEDDALAEHGWDEARLGLAAQRFIDSLPAPERLLLCEGFAGDPPGGLSGVAASHAIAAYHYRAGRLGLVHRNDAPPRDYARTRIGRWIEQTLGIAIAAENQGAVLRVLQILAAEASR